MKKIKKTKSFNFALSQIDYKNLIELSNDSEMKPAEFLRTLIQVTYIAKQVQKEIQKKVEITQIEIGGYGITFPKEFLQEFEKKLSTAFENINWNSIEITQDGYRHYRPK